MAYRRPGVTVTQEFVGLVPALSASALPSVTVGPAYQLVDNDYLGLYDGTQHAYAYASVIAGAAVDLAVLAPDEKFPITKKPLTVVLQRPTLEIIAPRSTGVGAGAAFTDATSAAFAAVLPGDYVVVTTGANAGSYLVMAKVDANTLTLQIPVPVDGASIAYKVTRTLTVDVELARGASGFTADASAVTLPLGLQVLINSVAFDVTSARVEASYRALRGDLAAEVHEIGRIGDIEALFGSGQIHPANPLAFALQIMKQNTVSPVNGLGLSLDYATDEVTAFVAAADVLSQTEMYAISLLSQNPVVATTFKNHAEQLSAPGKKRERVALFSSTLKSVQVLQDGEITTSDLLAARVVATSAVGAAASGSADVLNDVTSGLFDAVEVGDSVILVAHSGITDGTYTVLAKPSATSLQLSASFLTGASQTDLSYTVARQDGLEADGKTFYDRNAAFVSNGVSAGHYLTVLAGADAGRFKIATVLSEKKLVLSAAIIGVSAVTPQLSYQIDRDLQKSEQAALVAGFSSALGSRRVVHVWPDVVKLPVGQTIQKVPGYYLTAAVAALTTGLPPQQGLTNLALSGFLGSEHGSKYFNDDQLDAVAEGGTMVMAQDGGDQPLYCRHQLTTDRSAIKFQEYSITKNVDFASKFLRSTYRRFVGQYNIVDTTITELKSTAKAATLYLRDTTRIAKFGGVIRAGALKTLVESPDQIDTVLLRFRYDFPVPLNGIDIAIEA
jgi:hypothetical protein